MFLAKAIFTHLDALLLLNEKPVALHEPQFIEEDIASVIDCLRSGWVSSAGRFVECFERQLTEITGAAFAVATMNGTSALHACLMLAGVLPNEEVLVPTLTFVGTVNAIAYCRAIPHFVDSTPYSLGVDAVLLQQYLRDIAIVRDKICINRFTKRIIRALCVVHVLGHPADLDALDEICAAYHLHLIEDAAEAFGSYYKGIHVGYRGVAGALSFNGNKIITTGGGGAILTNSATLAKQARHLTTTAKKEHQWLFDHDAIAYNYRLPNLNAALGYAQLKRLNTMLVHKRALAQHYQIAFSSIAGIHFFREPDYAKSNYWLNAILLDETDLLIDHLDQRNKLIAFLHAQGYLVRPLWNLQHTMPMYQHCPSMPLLQAENLVKRVITLPSSAHLRIA